MSQHEMTDLVPLYALDALEDVELRGFESHLTGCAECQIEVDIHRATMSSLVPDEAPSEATWRRIQSTIAAEEGSHDSSSNRASMSGWKWFAGIAAAAAVVLGGVLFVQLMDPSISDQSIVAGAEQTARDPGSLVGDFLVDDVAVAQVVVGSDGMGFVVPTDALEPLDASRTYQLWVINDAEEVISAGVLGSAPAPATFTWTGDIAGFALTREVAGGVVSSEGDVVAVITDL